LANEASAAMLKNAIDSFQGNGQRIEMGSIPMNFAGHECTPFNIGRTLPSAVQLLEERSGVWHLKKSQRKITG
jgi:hypothetical protein